MLSGPAKEHESFWTDLSKQVNIEPPEELDRYIGRYHKFADIEIPRDMDLHVYFKSQVQANDDDLTEEAVS